MVKKTHSVGRKTGSRQPTKPMIWIMSGKCNGIRAALPGQWQDARCSAEIRRLSAMIEIMRRNGYGRFPALGRRDRNSLPGRFLTVIDMVTMHNTENDYAPAFQPFRRRRQQLEFVQPAF
ncbi:hypothetical protein GRI97_17290 [Altererythrobacter xixiisoli]|uniref:Uncharacterized protein n=1 Tax=Croceibacterium xixiisoli TaxID=1476466 RepID=A0A6I4U1D8_9SPHN|nr:hypothetical protein [Croceibacterium xixiisoli]